MSGLSIKYPEQAPAWLADWLSDKELRVLFKPGIISAACGALARPGGGLTLSWEKDFLQARIGVFTCTWRCQNAVWRPHCNCNYPDAYCLHSYAAGLLLAEVCRQQGWSQANINPKPLPASKPQLKAAVQRSFMLDLFSDEKPPQRKMSLEVEADFHHEPGRVGLRFYTREEDRRQLLKLGNVYMYAGDLLQENRWNPRSWPEADSEFLKWVIAPLRKIPLRQHDLRMLNLSAEDFFAWRKRWSGQPQRFLSRSTQEFIAPPGGELPARLIIEIEALAEGWRIKPVFIFPDGHRRQPHEIMRQLVNDPNRLEIRRQLLAWEPPIAWATLNHWFGSSKPLLLGTGENLTRLNEILQGRFDLLEGKCLEKVLVNSSEIGILADFKLGKFQVSCSFQGEKVPLEQEWPPCSRIEKSANGFKVQITAADEQALQLREDLRAFGKRLGQIQEFQVQLQGNLKNAMELRDFWRSLPAALSKQIAPSLKGLLQGEPGELTTELNLRGQGGLLELGINWQQNGISIPAAELQNALRYQQPVM
ncbi:MAG: hypothetical protein M0Q95_19935, partial [Porticoccaceae bacterium]|nr:hypothetical protein [Porticoccaceae bacterium]